MITPDELRIGNVATLNGREYVVAKIGEPDGYGFVYVSLKGFGSGEDYDTSMDVQRSSGDLMGIALTKKMLEDKGFKEVSKNEVELNGFKVVIKNGIAHEFIFGDNHLSGQHYIHQFQNNYKDFTGEDGITVEEE